jgi:hypothetical protein
MNVKVFNSGKSYKTRTRDPLPDLPFRMLIAGPSGSGKSNFLLNLISRPDWLGSYFKKTTYIFSPSLNLNDDFNSIKDAHKFQPETFQELETKLNRILEKQEGIIKTHGKKKAYHLLIVLDDCAAMSGFHESKILQKLFFRGRHCLISLIITSQSYKSIPKKVRSNCSHWVIFRPMNMSELDDICSDLFRKKQQKALADRLESIFEQPYSFIYIQNEITDYTKKYMVNMEKYFNP